MKNSYAFKLERYLIADWSLPVIALGLDIFLLFSQWNWYNYYVNMVAKATLDVYLIHQYWPLADIIFGRWVNIAPIFDEHYSLLSLLLLYLFYILLVRF